MLKIIWAKEGVEKKFQSFNIKLENIIANCDLFVMDQDLTNKNMKNTLISNKSFRGIIKNYFGVLWHTKVEVLGVVNDEKIKFEGAKYLKELQVDFIRIIKYNIR